MSISIYCKHKTAMKNNLIGLIDQTYPGLTTTQQMEIYPIET
ncbi:hypothetical protein [Schaedlerella arabinosiphila]|nr:hypothetical protein [Schaedlerella arabinosiphila]